MVPSTTYLTNSKPKIGAYHFTTLVPNIGVAQASGESYVIADIPGINLSPYKLVIEEPLTPA